MENKYNNTVIKVITKEQGVEVIKWWQSIGVNTRNIEGKVTDYCYGIVNNRFDIVSFDFAIFSKLKIIKLPKTEENMENLIGRKCKGFKFEDSTTCFQPSMSEYINQIGGITRITDTKNVKITFEDGGYYYYPLSEVHKHLIPLEDEIPTLGEGKLMLVSDDEKEWVEIIVCFKMNDKYYGKDNKKSFTLTWWNFAKEIETEEIVELTLKDISEGKGVGVKPSLIRIKE